MTDETGEAERIAAAVETELASEAMAAAPTPEAKQAIAQRIYLTWRNATLGDLNPTAFAQVETASAVLITAIAAQL